MEEFIKIKRTKQEVELMSPLTWAYVGDSVYELYIRNYLVNTTNQKPHKLHLNAIKYVKAPWNISPAPVELYIRTKLINETNLKPHKLHIESIKYVKAGAQAELLNKIYDTLTEEEQDIVRRARNTQNHHLPKNSNVTEYMYATAFEGLIGYLYLTKQNERLENILTKLVD